MIKTTIRIVELNNKSRKGEYIYIKKTKKPGRYYKYDTEINLEIYKKIYERGFQKTRKKTQGKPTHKKLPRITKILGKGIGRTTIKNITTASLRQIHNAKKRMLKPLVKDKQILNQIAKNENTKKLANRIKTTINLYDGNKYLGNIIKIGITPEETQKQIKESKILGEDTRKTPNKIKYYEKKGWKQNIYKEGKITRMEVNLTFTKNK